MEKTVLHVQMLGEFSLSYGDVRISDKSSRAYKLWQLIAYMIYHRRRTVSKEEMLQLLGDSGRYSNPSGALKTARMRARRMIEPISLAAGQELLISRDGGYAWNPEVPVALDTEAFEDLCQQASQAEGSEKTALFAQALRLFRGEFLSRLAGETWVDQISAFFNHRYLEAVEEAVPLMIEEGMCVDAAAICRTALKLSPYHEPLYRLLMHSLAGQGDYAAADEVFQSLRDLLSNELGVLPDEETRLVHQEIVRHLGEHTLPVDAIRDQLQEHAVPTGAILCDYPTLKLLYQVEARSADRRGDAVHVGILNVEGKRGAPLSDRSLKIAMEALGRQIQSTLRVGDVAACCSASQYLILLVQANYENGLMVCQRVARAFARAHPRSPAEVHCSVIPLESPRSREEP